MLSMGMCNARSHRLFLLASLLCNLFFFLKVYQLSREVPAPASFKTQVIRYDTCNKSSVSIASRQILFVGGCPRSGTTLARAMLDAHPDVHCGEETRVVPRLLGMRNRWYTSEKEHNRLREAGLGEDVLDEATAAFISEIILHHGEPAKFLCNKDPLVLNYMHDVIRMFPKAKFVLMIRDARAVAYSIVSRNVTISGVNNKNYLSAALFWNKVMSRMVRDCRMFGERRCLMVQYERLVQDPKGWMEKVLGFGGIPWHDNVLHHHELINQEVFLSK